LNGPSGGDPYVYVVSLGAATSVGRDAWSSAAAVRAGISSFGEHPYMIDTAGEPMRVAMAPWLDITCDGVARFEALLLPAIEQALLPLATAGGEQLRVALALGLPAGRPGIPRDLEDHLRMRIAQEFSNWFSAVAVLPVGHAAGFLGVHAAHRWILDGEFDACVVSGVDSYLAPETLDWLEENEQLHGAGSLNNAWGFIPGEGAGAVLLLSAEATEQLELLPLARVIGAGAGQEPNRIKTPTVCIGEGLTAAFREALSGLPPGEKVTDIFCDLNGEPYRADEFGFATLRTNESFLSAADFVAPADCWGDVSAASGPLVFALSTIASWKGYARGSYAFLWASSESGERGAVLLELPRPTGVQRT
jgi:3-oxoacyl-[acyl-carrier-protein] synthase I